MNPAWVDAALATTPVARLATVGDDGAVRLVPVCFAQVGGALASAVDHKPKRTGQLRRLDDMRATRVATMLLDHYEDDWTRLWWIRVRGAASVLDGDDPMAAASLDALASKYHQYAERRPSGPVWMVALDELRWWRAAG
jgi:PPOX class probable F420-dependent enzyme